MLSKFDHIPNTVPRGYAFLPKLYRRRIRRILGEELISRHFEHGHLKAVSFGKTMWPQFSQINRPLERMVIGENLSPTTQ